MTETERRYLSFESSTNDRLGEDYDTLGKLRPKFLASYTRLGSLNAWRTTILSRTLSDEAMAFFVESHNDAILSHFLARRGLWRPSLQCLRSALENVCRSLYYADHPVELRMWAVEEHRIGFSALATYFLSHPDIKDWPDTIAPIPYMRKQYSTLSKAVHASGQTFRMTAAGEVPALSNPDAAIVGKWSTAERNSILAMNLLLCGLNSAELKGTRNRGLREVLGSLFTNQQKNALRQVTGVVIPK